MDETADGILAIPLEYVPEGIDSSNIQDKRTLSYIDNILTHIFNPDEQLRALFNSVESDPNLREVILSKIVDDRDDNWIIDVETNNEYHRYIWIDYLELSHGLLHVGELESVGLDRQLNGLLFLSDIFAKELKELYSLYKGKILPRETPNIDIYKARWILYAETVLEAITTIPRSISTKSAKK